MKKIGLCLLLICTIFLLPNNIFAATEKNVYYGFNDNQHLYLYLEYDGDIIKRNFLVKSSNVINNLTPENFFTNNFVLDQMIIELSTSNYTMSNDKSTFKYSGKLKSKNPNDVNYFDGGDVEPYIYSDVKYTFNSTSCSTNLDTKRKNLKNALSQSSVNQTSNSISAEGTGGSSTLINIFKSNYSSVLNETLICSDKLDVFTESNLNNYLNAYLFIFNDPDEGILNSTTCLITSSNSVSSLYNIFLNEISYLLDLSDDNKLLSSTLSDKEVLATWIGKNQTKINDLKKNVAKFIDKRNKYNEKVKSNPDYSDKSVCANTDFINAQIQENVKNGKFDSFIVDDESVDKLTDKADAVSDKIYENPIIKAAEFSNSCNLLSPQLVKLIKNSLWAISLIGIALTVVLTITELLALIADESMQKQKKIVKKFKNRIIAIVLLILAPIVTDLFIDLILNNLLNYDVTQCKI